MLIGITGKKGVGKSTACDFLCSFIKDKKCVNLAFADALKNGCKEIFGLTHQQVFGSQEDKEKIDEFWEVSPRVIMQNMGTSVRNLPPPLNTTWIKNVEKKIREQPSNTLILVSDVRYPNEAQMIKDLGGIIIKIERNTENIDSHESENQHIKEDYLINNNGNIEKLHIKLLNVINENF